MLDQIKQLATDMPEGPERRKALQAYENLKILEAISLGVSDDKYQKNRPD